MASERKCACVPDGKKGFYLNVDCPIHGFASSPPASAGREEEPIDSELLDTAECSTHPNRGRCTHVRCLLRERNRLQYELASSRSESSRLREAVEKLNRYECTTDSSSDVNFGSMAPAADGEYVKWEDVRAALSPQPKEGA